MDEVKSLGYKYLRVYTDKIENFVSTKLYDKVFDIKTNILNVFTTLPPKIKSIKYMIKISNYYNEKN